MRLADVGEEAPRGRLNQVEDVLEPLAAAVIGIGHVALTDLGSPLEREAQARGFRRTFETPDNVGGRFSALTFIGLVPMALLGVDLDEIIGYARRMQIACGPEVHAAACPGVALGTALAELEREGLGIIHLVASEPIRAFPHWIEQILAESTGKDGRGLIPVVYETTEDAGGVPSDRLLISIELKGDRALADRMDSRIAAGAPAIRIVWPSREAIGGEFVRWEIATATAGALMGINPFDEPDVALSKEATAELLREFGEAGDFPRRRASASAEGIQAFLGSEDLSETLTPDGSSGRGAERSPGEVLKAFVEQAGPEKYVAVLPYFRLTPTRRAGLRKLRRALEAHGAATTLAQGPRYLHSTGQLHKGGPDCGMFLILTADPVDRILIPETDHGFADLQRAQALGDYRALVERDRPVLHIELGWYVDEAVDRLVEELNPGVAKPSPTVRR